MSNSTRSFYCFLVSIVSFGIGIFLGCDLCTCPGGVFIAVGLLGGFVSIIGIIIFAISELVDKKKKNQISTNNKKS